MFAENFASVYSRSVIVLSGEPQGSHLGPILFTYFINDICDCIKSANFLLFAYHIKLFSKITCPMNSSKLQGDLDRVMEWSKANGLSINLSNLTLVKNRHPYAFD